jgi:endonuclease/exonuclease/phosphatase family metal-dependent hydrolase
VFDLLAVWSDYAFEKYEPGINPGAYGVEFFKPLLTLPLVVAGDFNSPINYKAKSKGGFLYTHRVLEEYGLVKAYNVATGEELFRESQATFYRNYKREHPRHIDHIYVPRKWKDAIVSARCGEHDKWVSKDVAHRSNHAPLIVEIEDSVLRMAS